MSVMVLSRWVTRARGPVAGGAVIIATQSGGHVLAENRLVVAASYQPEPQAVGAARRFVRDTLRAWLDPGQGAVVQNTGLADLIDDAVLLTSELVTNAVVHAGTPVHVLCRLADTVLEIAVLDYHPARLVPEHVPGGEAPAGRTYGRGLLLPARLASSWGITYASTCKAVWFRLAVAVPADAVPATTALAALTPV
jgi:anti-sigma regulatory factor (Ser/Thr protein kinase)